MWQSFTGYINENVVSRVLNSGFEEQQGSLDHRIEMTEKMVEEEKILFGKSIPKNIYQPQIWISNTPRINMTFKFNFPLGELNKITHSQAVEFFNAILNENEYQKGVTTIFSSENDRLQILTLERQTQRRSYL